MSLHFRRLACALVLTVSSGLSGVFLAGLSAGTARWEFNGNLNSSTGQVALEAVGFPGVAGAPGVTFTTAVINGRTAQVAELTRGTALVVRHGFPANGGGTYLNDYTLVMDVLFPGPLDWTSLYQTNQAYDDGAGQFDLSNSNDGELFLDPDGALGIDGNYGGALAAATWYRLALSVDSAAHTFTTFVDGVQVQQNTNIDVDGRWSLYNTTNPDP